MNSRAFSEMPISKAKKALLVAAYFRGGNSDDRLWASNCDQVVTLSLFYTGHISFEECAERFSRRSYVGGLYQQSGKLDSSVRVRYRSLIRMLRKLPSLIEGGGNLKLPADPTYTSCRLTAAGEKLALKFLPEFRRKPDFPNWPDRRQAPQN